MAKRLTDHREEPTQAFYGPPKAEDVLAVVATRWAGSRFIHKAHETIPRNPREVAAWWMRHQAKPLDGTDNPTQHNAQDGSGTVWKTPYIDRLRYTLTKFLHHEKSFQGLIVAAAEDGIFWNGDSRESFITLIANHERMRNEKNYRASTLSAMNESIGAMRSALSMKKSNAA